MILSGPSANIRLLWVRFSSPTQRNVYNGPASASATGRLSIIVSVQAITSELNNSPCSAFYGGCKRDTARPHHTSVEAAALAVPVRQRVVFKIAGLVHQSLGGAAPAYLADDCRLLSDVGRRQLRFNSNDMRKLLVPPTHNKLGGRSFSAAGPRPWNDLPPGLRRPGLTFDSFRQSLKTHLFGDRSA